MVFQIVELDKKWAARHVVGVFLTILILFPHETVVEDPFDDGLCSITFLIFLIFSGVVLLKKKKKLM